MREEVEVLEDHPGPDAQLTDLLALRARAMPAALDSDAGDLDRSLCRLLEEV